MVHRGNQCIREPVIFYHMETSNFQQRTITLERGSRKFNFFTMWTFSFKISDRNTIANKTDHHNITEILLKVVLNTIVTLTT
jgi:hypothetical protein